MAFPHYLSASGVELINSERTAAYVAHGAPQMPFKPDYTGDRIHVALGDAEYRSPLIDGAPWANPLDLASDQFYGLYPIEIDGIGDSTYTASTTESMDDGGSVDSGRSASRTIKVSGLLIGASQRACQLGLSWLRQAVLSDDCDGCTTGGMDFFLAEPEIADQTWGDESGSLTRGFGNQGVGRVSYRWQDSEAPVGMPLRAIWEFVPSEGTVVSFGLKERFTTVVVDQGRQVAPYRVNYFPNPTLRADLTGWQVQAGRPSWSPTGGADGASYGRVEPIVGTGTTSRAYGTGEYGVGAYGTSNYGGAQGAAVQVTSATPISGQVTASIALKTDAANMVTLSLVNGVGVVVASQRVATSMTWGRYSLTASLSGAQISTLSLQVSAAAPIDFDQAMLEVGGIPLPYFDGQTPEPGAYVASWEGAQDTSRSVQRWTDVAQVCHDDSDVSPFIQIVQGTVGNLTLRWFVRPLESQDEVLEPWLRTYYEVSCTQGPQIVQEFGDGTGAYFIQVEILFVAGNPYAYAPPIQVPATPTLTDLHTDVAVVPLDDSWLVDPDCTPVTAPVAAPLILDDCIETITAWQRYYFPIPADDVADWASSVPTLVFDSGAQAIRQVRVRFHPNPFGWAPQQVDPASYCSEFTISYLPAVTHLEVNGATRTATASKTGVASVDANYLLYGSTGEPITWPELTCGVPYVLTVDVPPASTIDLFDLSVALQRRE